jgi:hypothetical protein
MRTLIEILAGLAILANAIIYGTDVFGAIILRPVIAAVDDRTLTQLVGHIHRIADRRQLQARWDSVINARVAVQTLALAALCVALAAA